MNFLVNLVCVGSVLGYGLDITRVYAVGDSYTDTGNVFKLSNFTKPDPKYYSEGRFSNGPVWIERFETKLPSKPKVISFAYGSATSNNTQFPESVPDANEQVVKNFAEYYQSNKEDYEKHLNTSLVSFSFAPNDLTYPNGDPKLSIENLVKSVVLLAGTYHIPNILITVTNASPFMPHTKKMPEAEGKLFIERSTQLTQYWDVAIKELSKHFPKTKFMKLSYQKFHREQISKPNPATGKPWIQDTTCLTAKANSTTEFDICSNPQDHIYWDDAQITTDFHGHYFEHVLNLLQEEMKN